MAREPGRKNLDMDDIAQRAPVPRSRQRISAKTHATDGSAPITEIVVGNLDAMDPNDLRECVEEAIQELIEPEAWKRCEVVNRAEQESLKTIIEKWGRP